MTHACSRKKLNWFHIILTIYPYTNHLAFLTLKHLKKTKTPLKRSKSLNYIKKVHLEINVKQTTSPSMYFSTQLK